MLLASTGTSYLLLLSARPATTKEPTGSWQCRYGNLSILPLIKTCPRYRNLYFSAGKLYSHSQKLLPTKYLSFEKQFLLSKETTLSLVFRYRSRPCSFTTRKWEGKGNSFGIAETMYHDDREKRNVGRETRKFEGKVLEKKRNKNKKELR